jgi:hypothetical protein
LTTSPDYVGLYSLSRLPFRTGLPLCRCDPKSVQRRFPIRKTYGQHRTLSSAWSRLQVDRKDCHVLVMGYSRFRCSVAVKSGQDVLFHDTMNPGISFSACLASAPLSLFWTHVHRHELQHPILCKHTQYYFLPRLFIRVYQWQPSCMCLDKEFAGFEERSHRMHRQKRRWRYSDCFLNV